MPAHSWALAEEVPAPSTKIVLTVAVRQSEQGKQKLREEILARSDPDSPLYSQWLSKAQVDDLVRPAPEAVRAVTEWLERAGAMWSGAECSSASRGGGNCPAAAQRDQGPAPLRAQPTRTLFQYFCSNRALLEHFLSTFCALLPAWYTF